MDRLRRIGAARAGGRFVVALALATSTGCMVSKRDYDACVADATSARSGAAAREKEDAARLAELQAQLAAVEAASQARDAKMSELTTAAHNAQTQLEEATAINQQLRAELSRLGKDVDQVLSDRGMLSKALDDAHSRLEELRKAQSAAEARTALLRELEQKFKPLAEAGQLRVGVRHGWMVIDVNADLLFEPGRAELRTAGKGALMEIAHALETSASGSRFQVTAHADDEPVAPPLASRRFKSAWELTAARAVAVVEFLVTVHVPAGSLVAAAAASFDPVATDSSPDARAKNRRVEIALLP
jgi:chemotaxis protein MotB